MRPSVKRAVIYAALIALGINRYATAQTGTGSSVGAKAGIPWSLETSIGGARLWPESSGEVAEAAYQIEASERFVFQPFARAWFQAGLQSRSTLLSGMDGAVDEPASFNAMGNLEILPGFLYVSGGFAFSFFEETLAQEDSAALFAFQNGYRSGLSPLGLNGKTLFGGAYLRQHLGPWLVLAGLSMGRSAPVRLYDDVTVIPPQQLNGSLRLRHRHAEVDHRVEVAATYFGEEKDAVQRPVHQEGMRFYFRYSLSQIFGPQALEMALGGTAHTADRNRRLLIHSELPEAGVNDNLQRIFADGTWIWRMNPKWLVQIYARPSLIFQAGNEGMWGHETEIFLRSRWRLFRAHDLELAPGGVVGRFDGEAVMALAFKMRYAFHHLPARTDGFTWEPAGDRK